MGHVLDFFGVSSVGDSIIIPVHNDLLHDTMESALFGLKHT